MLLAPQSRGCIWPAPYDEDSADAAYRFITECWWTDNEADQKIALVPDKPFVLEFVTEWVNAFHSRQPLVVEKTRRMIVSWISRGLETWVMGMQRGSWIIIDQTHTNAAEHLWRIHFALEQLRDRRPEMGISHRTFGSVDKKEPTHILLPNGSTITQSHQEAGSAQGKGKTGITLEEISKYAAPSAFWGQAVIVTQGEGSSLGGWVCGIANASPNPDWQLIKPIGVQEDGRPIPIKARQFLGLPPLR